MVILFVCLKGVGSR